MRLLRLAAGSSVVMLLAVGCAAEPVAQASGAAEAIERDTDVQVESCSRAYDYLDDPQADEAAIIEGRWRCVLSTPREHLGETATEWCFMWYPNGEEPARDLGYPPGILTILPDYPEGFPAC